MSRFHLNRETRYMDPVDPEHPLRAIELWEPRWSNCLIWAAHMQKRYGGYTLKRRALAVWRWHRSGRDHAVFFPHAMWSPDGAACYEYTAKNPPFFYWWQLPVFILYRGYVQRIQRKWL